MLHHSDVRPWEMVAGAPQVAGEYVSEPAGVQANRGSDDPSPWYVGDRYFASASDAAFWRGVAAQPIRREQRRA